MGIEFARGAFENPDDPSHDDDVDTSIVVVTAPARRRAAARAVERCRERWRGIDGAGRCHGPDDVGFWEVQLDNHGPEWHTAKYVSDVVVDADGIAIYVDCQGLMPEPMRAAYRDVLVEEWRAAGVEDAVVRSRHAADHEVDPEPPAGPWPPYMDLKVPGLPPGVPPGRVIHHELRRHSELWNSLLRRNFRSVWQASALAVTDLGPDEAVRRACQLFGDAGWAAREIRAMADWGGKPPLVAAALAIPGAVAVVTGRETRHVRDRGPRLPSDADYVVTAVAYYDLAPPTSPTAPATGGSDHEA